MDHTYVSSTKPLSVMLGKSIKYKDVVSLWIAVAEKRLQHNLNYEYDMNKATKLYDSAPCYEIN